MKKTELARARVTRPLKKKLTEYAEKNQMNVSEAIREALYEKIEDREKRDESKREESPSQGETP